MNELKSRLVKRKDAFREEFLKKHNPNNTNPGCDSSFEEDLISLIDDEVSNEIFRFVVALHNKTVEVCDKKRKEALDCGQTYNRKSDDYFSIGDVSIDIIDATRKELFE